MDLVSYPKMNACAVIARSMLFLCADSSGSGSREGLPKPSLLRMPSMTCRQASSKQPSSRRSVRVCLCCQALGAHKFGFCRWWYFTEWLDSSRRLKYMNSYSMLYEDPDLTRPTTPSNALPTPSLVGPSLIKPDPERGQWWFAALSNY